MKTGAFLSGWLVFLVGVGSASAEYEDGRGVKRVGTPETVITTNEWAAVHEREKVPNAYGPHYQRMVNGKAVDFSDAIRWANECLYSLGEFNTPEQLKRFREQWGHRFDWAIANADKWRNWMIGGKVIQATEDGVLLDCGETWVLLKNHPRWSALSEGQGISIVAMPVEKRVIKIGGGNRIVRLYDYGIPVTSSQPASAGSLTNQVSEATTNLVRPR
jgi:hypothetical protein